MEGDLDIFAWIFGCKINSFFLPRKNIAEGFSRLLTEKYQISSIPRFDEKFELQEGGMSKGRQPRKTVFGGIGDGPFTIERSFFPTLLSYRWPCRGRSTTSPSAHRSRRPGPSGRSCRPPPPPWPAAARPSRGTSRAPRGAAPSRGCGAPRSPCPRRCRSRRSPLVEE